MFVLKGWTGTQQQAEDLMAVPVEINIVDNKPTFALGRFEDNPPFGERIKFYHTNSSAPDPDERACHAPP